ncbi:MAG: hypothetical protein JNJ57_07060 [Saprospiraceae bacterium]|nr:hypothetical protein [Saprospiraceae bacterium]
MDLAAILFIKYSMLFTMLPLAIAAVRFFRHTPATRIVAGLIVVACAIQWLASVMTARKMNNLKLLHLYTILEFAIITWYFSETLKGVFKRRFFWLVGIGFAALSILNSLFLQDLQHFNTYARSLEGILVITYCLIWYFRTLSEMKVERLQDDPVFWINTGFLLYFSGGVLLFSVSNYILELNRSLNLYVWAFHGLFTTIMYTLIAIGLWKLPAK